MARSTIEVAAEIDFRCSRRVWTLALAQCVEYEGDVVEVVGGLGMLGDEQPVFRVLEPAQYAGLERGVPVEYLPEHVAREVRSVKDWENFSPKKHPIMCEVLICDMPLAAQPNKAAVTHSVDGWQLRDDFFAVKHDTNSLIEFLNRYGSWTENTDPRFISLELKKVLGQPWKHAGVKANTWWEPAIVTPDQIWKMEKHSEDSVSLPANLDLADRQSVFRNVLTSASREWFNLGITRDLPFRADFPYLSFSASNILDVICNTITVDHLRNTKYRICARMDCGKPFPVESQHNKMYCQQYCAHLESVRRNRRK